MFKETESTSKPKPAKYTGPLHHAGTSIQRDNFQQTPTRKIVQCIDKDIRRKLHTNGRFVLTLPNNKTYFQNFTSLSRTNTDLSIGKTGSMFQKFYILHNRKLCKCKNNDSFFHERLLMSNLSFEIDLHDSERKLLLFVV